MKHHTGHSRAGFHGLSGSRGPFANHVVPAVRTALQGYAAKWQSSADIREVFGTFEAYAASMAAKVKQ